MDIKTEIEMSDPYHLRPLWDAILEVYGDYASICERYHLRHYICAGTLLGAIRHGGFIPWDDDFDVCMPRPDYERFKAIAAQSLPDHLKWVDRHNTPEFRLLFGKIQDCRSDKVALVEQKIGYQLSNGIFIDIYPIDGYPNSRVGAMMSKIKECLLVKTFTCISFVPGSVPWSLKSVATFLIGKVLRPFAIGMKTYKEYADLIERHQCRLTFDDSKWTGTCGCWVGRFQRVLPPGVWGRPTIVDFGGVQMPAPAKAELLLRSVYGDYMKLPPEDRRHPSHEYESRCPWWLGPTNSKV